MLVKIMRCLANLALTPRLRAQVARNADINCIMEILGGAFLRIVWSCLLAPDCLSASDSRRSAFEEELVLNAVAAAHNLVYASQSDSCLWAARLQLLPLLVQQLFDSNAAIVSEAASAIANLSFADDVRVSAVRCGALQVCVVLLDHSDIAVCHAVCGLIMNLSANSDCASHLLKAGAHFKLVEAATAYSGLDSGDSGRTSSIAFRALANVRLFPSIALQVDYVLAGFVPGSRRLHQPIFCISRFPRSCPYSTASPAYTGRVLQGGERHRLGAAVVGGTLLACRHR